MMLKLISRSHETDGELFVKEFSELPSRGLVKSPGLAVPPAQYWQKLMGVLPKEICEYWLVVDEGKTLGRIGANLLPSYPHLGAIGFFTVDLVDSRKKEISAMLLDATTIWLKAKGCESATGPININTWFPYRFRLDQEPQHFVWEPSNSPEYPSLWLENGFKNDKNYYCVGNDNFKGVTAKTEKSYKKATELGFSFRKFDKENFFEKDLPKLHELTLKSYTKNYLFEPISFEGFKQLYVPVMHHFDWSESYFVQKGTQEVGFLFCFVDQEYFVYKTAGVLPDFQGKGLYSALVHKATIEASRKYHLDKFISAPFLEDNPSQTPSKKTAVLWTHHYVLMSKSL